MEFFKCGKKVEVKVYLFIVFDLFEDVESFIVSMFDIFYFFI